MSIELLPCPHCNSKELTFIAFTDVAVMCKQCGTQGPAIFNAGAGFEKTRLQAILKWNCLPRKIELEPNDVDCKGCPERKTNELIWTKEKPTKDNHWQWFWYNEGTGRDPYPLYIQGVCCNGEIIVVSSKRPDSDCFLPVDKMGGYWAGPISEPEWK